MENLQEIGSSAYSCIKDMVAALQCDYDRLEELRGERDEYAEPVLWSDDNPDDASELAELEAEAGECESEDDARQRISEDPLEIKLSGSWGVGETPEADSYMILLGTGGPATRIVGTLGAYNEPDSATLESQDWGTQWTEFRGGDQAVLLAYAQCFHFGE